MLANQGRRSGQLPPSGQPLSSLKILPFLSVIPLTLPDVGKPEKEGGATAPFRSASVLPESFSFFLSIIPLTLPDVGKPGEEAGASVRSASVLP